MAHGRSIKGCFRIYSKALTGGFVRGRSCALNFMYRMSSCSEDAEGPPDICPYLGTA